MSNQVIQWSMFILPWFTLLFMKKEDIKRYMPVALFAVVLTTIIHDVGTTLGFWVVQEAAFPFNEMLPYFYGTMPVLTIWVFKFTYSRFWLYMVTNLILDIGFNSFLLSNFLPSRGIYGFALPPLRALSITLTHAILIYGYQMWQDGIFARSERTNASPNLQPAAAKPIDQDHGCADESEPKP